MLLFVFIYVTGELLAKGAISAAFLHARWTLYVTCEKPYQQLHVHARWLLVYMHDQPIAEMQNKCQRVDTRIVGLLVGVLHIHVD